MRIFTLLTILFLAISPFVVSESFADPPGGKKASPGWQKGDKGGWKSDRPPGMEKQKKQKKRPPGWNKGRKEGWDSDRPPGQEGKYQRDPRTRDWHIIRDRLPWLE